VQSILSCALDSWEIGIGDPGWGGWLIVALYAVTGLLALRVASIAPFPKISCQRERVFWGVLGGGLLLLGINKQLDLQTLLTDAARCLSQMQGWYEARRPIQIGFIIGILLLMLTAAAVACVALRGTLRRTGIALTGGVIVLGFVVIRAAGFHHMDRLIAIEVEAVRLNWLLEMAGPILILIAGLLALRERRPKG